MARRAISNENLAVDGVSPDKPGHQILEKYLSELRANRVSGAGVAETSYYPTLKQLFDAVGNTLKPKVSCFIQLKNLGAGYPDAGLFTAEQYSGELKKGQLPSRGAIEAKGTKPDIKAIAFSTQVKNYLGTYGIVIVTNLRDFMIVERGPNSAPEPRETFSLADNENDFWDRVAAHPRGSAQLKGDQFFEFIRRACLHKPPLTNPKDVAWFLASYARDALVRVEQQKHLPALQAIRTALEEALGMKFVEEKGEHFFRSTLVQTLFYGVFSAWVRWHRDNLPENVKFDWRTAEWSLHVPFIRTLYRQAADPRQLGALNLVELLDWSAGILNRVDRGAFFKQFDEQYAVQYFYEPFLQAYDPDLRKELGVWYTPPEIVKYQVARVDTVLREELDLPDGLADPNVIVLDPCCGTGAYLVEVLRHIERTVRDKHDDGLVGHDVKQAAMHRVFGFEIMPAPFVIAHMQIGTLMQQIGLPFSSPKGERAAVYLTNSLTGWEPPKGPKQHIMHFAELEEERDAAEQVKRDKRILVVLGNPPYNAYAGISPEEEQGLVEPYKKDLNKPISAGGWGIKKFNLDDLYVRFFRLAERRIAEMSGKGIVSFISNFSYLSDPSFVVMRKRFLAEFDKLWIDCMNGDSRETGKVTPDGKPDPSVFSTEHNREGIRVGTAVCVMVRKSTRQKKPTVRFRQFWGATKRADLVTSVNAKKFDKPYASANASEDNRYSLFLENVSEQYMSWPKLPDLCAVAPFNGPVERRGGSLVRFLGDEKLFDSLNTYFDTHASDEDVRIVEPRFMESSGEFRASHTRSMLKGKVKFSPNYISRYPFKPFDVRAAYLDPAIQPLFSRPSPQLLNQRFTGNSFFISRDTADKTPEGPPFFFSRQICDYDSISGHARHFPILLKNGSRLEKEAEATLFAALGDKPELDVPVANLSAATRRYFATIGIKKPDDKPKTAGLIWMHSLAIGFSPAYLAENADGIRRDWPRIPLPGNRKALEESAWLGEQIAALLDTEAEVPSITFGKLQRAIKSFAVMSKMGEDNLDPNAGDFNITAGWGHAGKENATMPGKGKLTERTYDVDEAKALEAEATARGMSAKEITQLLGEKTCDVYLNNSAYWRNIPINVWNYHIGGYQVIKKWLSYREDKILGRALKPEEAREVTNMARRIAAIILLQPQLDENYQKVKSATFDWASAISEE